MLDLITRLHSRDKVQHNLVLEILIYIDIIKTIARTIKKYFKLSQARIGWGYSLQTLS